MKRCWARVQLTSFTTCCCKALVLSSADQWSSSRTPLKTKGKRRCWKGGWTGGIGIKLTVSKLGAFRRPPPSPLSGEGSLSLSLSPSQFFFVLLSLSLVMSVSLSLSLVQSFFFSFFLSLSISRSPLARIQDRLVYKQCL